MSYSDANGLHTGNIQCFVCEKPIAGDHWFAQVKYAGTWNASARLAIALIGSLRRAGGSLVPVGSFDLLPVRIQGRIALLIGEARWPPNPDGRLANGIGLADSDNRLTDPDSGAANAHIRLAESDSRLSNAVGLADPRVWLTDSDGASANARIRFTNFTGALSNGVWLADSNGCCADANIRPASQTCWFSPRSSASDPKVSYART